MSGSVDSRNITNVRWQIMYASSGYHVLNFIAVDLKLYKIT